MAHQEGQQARTGIPAWQVPGAPTCSPHPRGVPICGECFSAEDWDNLRMLTNSSCSSPSSKSAMAAIVRLFSDGDDELRSSLARHPGAGPLTSGLVGDGEADGLGEHVGCGVEIC